MRTSWKCVSMCRNTVRWRCSSVMGFGARTRQTRINFYIKGETNASYLAQFVLLHFGL